jgi:uncharacterized membrane protein
MVTSHRSASRANVRRWLTEAEEARVVEALHAAERGNSGEVRVHLAEACPGDALLRAKSAFETLGMRATRADTGVLLFVAPKARKVAVYAGKGVYGGDAPRTWQRVVDVVAIAARKGNLAVGIATALELIGDILRKAMPSADEAGNELPDEVTAEAPEI